LSLGRRAVSEAWEIGSFPPLLQNGASARTVSLVVANVLPDFAGSIAQLATTKTGRHVPLADRSKHSLQQIVVVFIAVRLGVEIVRHPGEPLVADALDIFLHELVVVAPVDANRTHCGLLGPRRNLMRMQVVQPELIDQGLFHFLVQDEKAVSLDRAPAHFELARHAPVNVDGLTILAVACKIGNVVFAIELLHPAQDRIERSVEHEVGDVPLGQLELLVRCCGMTKVEGHDVDGQTPGQDQDDGLSQRPQGCVTGPDGRSSPATSDIT
jgi:hypothetical protein